MWGLLTRSRVSANGGRGDVRKVESFSAKTPKARRVMHQCHSAAKKKKKSEGEDRGIHSTGISRGQK